MVLCHLSEISHNVYSFLVDCEVENIKAVFKLELSIFLHWNGKSVKCGHIIICYSENHSFVVCEMLGADVSAQNVHIHLFAVIICFMHLKFGKMTKLLLVLNYGSAWLGSVVTWVIRFILFSVSHFMRGTFLGIAVVVSPIIDGAIVFFLFDVDDNIWLRAGLYGVLKERVLVNFTESISHVISRFIWAPHWHCVHIFVLWIIMYAIIDKLIFIVGFWTRIVKVRILVNFFERYTALVIHGLHHCFTLTGFRKDASNQWI